MRSEWRFGFGWPLAALAAVVILTPWFGAETATPAMLADPSERALFVQFRLTRLALGLLAGASLSTAGCLFQAVLRNPLASPYTLGVSTAAALGATAAIVFDFPFVRIASVAGALLGLALITRAGGARRRLSATSLILAGVSVNSVCSALIALLQNTAGIAKSFSVATWLVGALDAVSVETLAGYAAVNVPLALWVVWKAADWDLLSMGESWAAGRGVRTRSLILQANVAGSILTAATVSLTGPIGFVGLVVPHIVRRYSGPSHRRLLPAAFFLGGAFLILCDAAARTMVRPAEIPVGVLTALLGGPGLIWILRRTAGKI